jgi:16S rRNA processing protein RimM
VSSRRLRPAQTAAIAKDEVRLGHIVGVFGLAGEVRLFMYNPDTVLFDGDGAAAILVDEAGVRQNTTIRTRPGAGKRILGRVSGVQNPEAARALVGVEIVLAEAALPEPESDEYYHHQLIGLPVKSASGEVLGRLTAIHPGPETDVWVVSGPDGQVMIPAVQSLVVSVDLEEGVTVVDDAGRML